MNLSCWLGLTKTSHVFTKLSTRSLQKTAVGGKLFLALALCCFANLAHAALSTITVNASLSPQAADYSDEPLSFQEFDPSLGRLKSVRVILRSKSILKQEYENTSDTDRPIRLRQTLDFILELPDATTKILKDRQRVTHKYSTGAFDGDIDFDGTSGGATEYDISTTNQKLLKSRARMAMFTGSGLANLFMSADTTFLVSQKGDVPVTQTEASAGADVTIIYNYIAVAPEPIWYGLFAGVVALVSVFSHRGHRKSTSDGVS